MSVVEETKKDLKALFAQYDVATTTLRTELQQLSVTPASQNHSAVTPQETRALESVSIPADPAPALNPKLSSSRASRPASGKRSMPSTPRARPSSAVALSPAKSPRITSQAHQQQNSTNANSRSPQSSSELIRAADPVGMRAGTPRSRVRTARPATGKRKDNIDTLSSSSKLGASQGLAGYSPPKVVAPAEVLTMTMAQGTKSMGNSKSIKTSPNRDKDNHNPMDGQQARVEANANSLRSSSRGEFTTFENEQVKLDP